MSDRTDRLAQIDRWDNLGTRYFGGWCVGTALCLAILIVTDGEQEQATGLPLSILFATVVGVLTAGVSLILGMALRWLTLPRRFTLPTCCVLIFAGMATSILCLIRTLEAPRTPIGTTDLWLAPACYLGMLAAVFGAVNWPRRPRR